MKHSLLSFVVLVFSQASYAQISDEVMKQWLPETIITAERIHYRQKGDLLIYEVSADSTLRGKSSYEALRKTPLIIADKVGNVKTSGGWSVEYLVNGTHDKTLSGNIYDALSALDVKYLKRIEVRIDRNTEGEEVLQVNFITRGRLLGYRGILSSSLRDYSWRNGGYVFATQKHLGLSVSYNNIWEWGHSSTKNTEEWRLSQPLLHHTTSNSTESGYRVNMNNVELQLSYEFSPLKVLAVYAEAKLKTNPHTNTNVNANAQTDADELVYRYNRQSDFKVNRDAEYSFSVDYEQLFGENAKNGKLFLSYNYYGRPLKTVTTETYHDLQFTDLAYSNNFYNSINSRKTYENWHTLLASLRYKWNKNVIYAEDYVRFRDESDDKVQTKMFDYVESPYNNVEMYNYKHRQLSNSFKVAYGFVSDLLQVNTGMNYIFLHDWSLVNQANNEFTYDENLLNPYADISLKASRRDRLRLSYTMGKQVADISALNPYIYTNVPGQLSYGNPHLKPQQTQKVELSLNHQQNRMNFYTATSYSLANKLVLQHSFLDKDGVLNITKDNIGKRHEIKAHVNASSKITRTTYVRLGADYFYTIYPSNKSYASNRGNTFRIEGYLEQEFRHNFDLSFSGGYNSSWIYLQGKGGENYYYGLNIIKNFPRKKLTISAEANNFIPLYFSSKENKQTDNYYYNSRNRTFHASFQLTLRWRFGKLKTEEYERDNTINYDDIKRNYDE